MRYERRLSSCPLPDRRGSVQQVLNRHA